MKRIVTVKSSPQTPSDTPVLAVFFLMDDDTVEYHGIHKKDWQTRWNRDTSDNSTFKAVLNYMVNVTYHIAEDTPFDNGESIERILSGLAKLYQAMKDYSVTGESVMASMAANIVHDFLESLTLSIDSLNKLNSLYVKIKKEHPNV